MVWYSRVCKGWMSFRFLHRYHNVRGYRGYHHHKLGVCSSIGIYQEHWRSMHRNRTPHHGRGIRYHTRYGTLGRNHHLLFCFHRHIVHLNRRYHHRTLEQRRWFCKHWRHWRWRIHQYHTPHRDRRYHHRNMEPRSWFCIC